MSGANSEISAKSHEEIALGDFTFSLDSKDLRDRSGDAVRLRNQSTEVLAHLAAHRNHLVLKDDLIRKIWPDTFVTDDSIGQCIVDIRRALNDLDHKIVQTFPKKGYMLVAEPVSAKAAEAPSPEPRAPSARGRSRVLSGAIVILALIALAVIWQPWSGMGDMSPDAGLALPDEPSIVVLPFENLSEQEDLDYFAAGFSTSIRTHLAKFPQLFVIAGSTSLSFKDSPGTARGIGRELGVKFFLDGTLRAAGETFVINTELIDTASEQSVWAQEYSFSKNDTIQVQEAIVQEITATLNVVIGEEELRAMRARSAKDPNAYDLYLRAVDSSQLLSQEGRERAIELLKDAIALDPGYLAAHFELSGRYLSLWRFGGAANPDEALHLARRHAERALEISRSDYRGHFRMGMLHLFADHEHELAHAAFLRAINDNPNDADILYNMGFLRALMGEPGGHWNGTTGPKGLTRDTRAGTTSMPRWRGSSCGIMPERKHWRGLRWPNIRRRLRQGAS